MRHFEVSEEVRPQTVLYYANQSGDEPFRDWLEHLSVSFQDRVFLRLQRVQLGNLGDHKGVGEGVIELRLHFGKGYRIYCGKEGKDIVVLLCGGDKSRQGKDIKLAKIYWKDYLASKEN